MRDTVRGATRPHRGTWLIWGVLAVVVCLSQRADGASWSLIMAGAQALLTSLIFVLAIRLREGGLSACDAVLIAIAGGGVVGWIVAEEPVVATACVIAADLIAAAMMVPKVYYCLVNGAIALLIHHRRAVLGAAPVLVSGRA